MQDNLHIVPSVQAELQVSFRNCENLLRNDFTYELLDPQYHHNHSSDFPLYTRLLEGFTSRKALEDTP